MKLTLPQKTAVAICLFTAILGFVRVVEGSKSAGAMLVVVPIICIFILWITGALKPIYAWLRGEKS